MSVLEHVCVWERETHVRLMLSLTGAVLMISVPRNGSNEVYAGKSCHETLESMSLAPIRAIGPVSEVVHRRRKKNIIVVYLYPV